MADDTRCRQTWPYGDADPNMSYWHDSNVMKVFSLHCQLELPMQQIILD